jgi:peroxiredoxin
VDLHSRYQDFQARNTEVVALAVHDRARAGAVAQVTGAPFPILADPDHTAAEAYGVYNLLGDGIATASVFIIDSSGNVVWSYVGQSASDRPGVEAILENLPVN